MPGKYNEHMLKIKAEIKKTGLIDRKFLKRPEIIVIPDLFFQIFIQPV